MLISVLLMVTKSQKKLKCLSSEEWIKICYIYMMEYYSATRKDEIMPIAVTRMNLDNVILS